MFHASVSCERTGRGEIIVVPFVGGESGIREADYIADLAGWNRQTGLVKSSVLQRFLIYRMGEIVLLPRLG
jgi:hypothetical protein